MLKHGNTLLARGLIKITDNGSARLHRTQLLVCALSGKHRQLPIGAITQFVNRAVEGGQERKATAIGIDLVERARMTPGSAQGKAHLA